MVLATLMRHQSRSVAPNATKPVTQLHTHKRNKSSKLETQNGSHSGSKRIKVHRL
jgi:hypothetical protein